MDENSDLERKYEKCDFCGRRFRSSLLQVHQSLAEPCLQFRGRGPCIVCHSSSTDSNSTDVYNDKQQLLRHLHDKKTKVAHTEKLLKRCAALDCTVRNKEKYRMKELPLEGYRFLLKTTAHQIQTMKDLDTEADTILSLKDKLLHSANGQRDKCLALKQRVHRFKSIVDEMQRYSTRCQEIKSDSKDVKKQVKSFELPECNGELVWRINQYKYKKRMTSLGDGSPVISPSFFSSDYGYKLFCRAYLNGYGCAKDKYMSVYVYVKKGEFDELLQWPFNNRFSVEILNHKDLREKSIKELMFESVQIERPEYWDEDGIGNDEFIEMNELENPDNGFLVDDCITLRIKVYESQ